MRVEPAYGELFSLMEPMADYVPVPVGDNKLPEGCEAKEVYNFLLLAYLDSAGYSERSNRKSPYDQFKAILERYFLCPKRSRRFWLELKANWQKRNLAWEMPDR